MQEFQKLKFRQQRPIRKNKFQKTEKEYIANEVYDIQFFTRKKGKVCGLSIRDLATICVEKPGENRISQSNLFNLKSVIADKYDWHNAYLLSQKILLELEYRLKQDSFLQVASQMLLTTSILVSRQTFYPDLLTVRTFVLLPKLTMRIFDADINRNVTNLGPEVDDGFQYILDIPNDPNIFESIVSAIVSAIDSYLYKINQVDFNLMLDIEDYTNRSDCLDRVLPLPSSEIISKLLAQPN